LNGVSCNSKSFCLAVGADAGEGVVVPITDGTPGTPEIFSAIPAFNAVNCSNSTTCVAVGSETVSVYGCELDVAGVVATFTNGTLTNTSILENECPPGGTEQVDLSGIGCIRGSTCMVDGAAEGSNFDNPPLGGIYDLVKKGSAQGGADEGSITPLTADGVACRSTGLCILTGQDQTCPRRCDPAYGFADEFVHGKYENEWVSGTGMLLGAACHPTGSCIAVGNNWNGKSGGPSNGVVLPIVFSTSQSPVTVPGTTSLIGVACSGPAYCAAVGHDHKGDGVLVPISYENVGRAEKVSGTSTLNGAACATLHFCVAVGQNSADEGVILTFGLPA
jgi:hypothetical protein